MSNTRSLPHGMKFYPSVFAMKDTYQIFVNLSCDATVWITVGDQTYYDHSNGILRSGKQIHSVEVPMEALNNACAYTVGYREFIERKPYFPTSREPVEVTFPFRPVKKDPIHLYHISDAHNMINAPVAAGRYFGEELDLLVLNGDIPNHSGKIEYFDTVYAIVSELTHGEIPTVFSRGNHDLRGIHAEDFADYTPSDHGKTYYTFRVGSIWGMVLDCGEDKPDNNEEYGYTICCHYFRRQETDFIRQVIANAETEYAAPDVEHKLIICHIPFTDIANHPFDIEQELYGEWTRLLREHVKPDLMLYGHSHVTEICPVGGPRDKQGQPCPAIIGSKPTMPKNGQEEAFVGCGVVLDGDRMRVIFNHSSGTVLEDKILFKGEASK